MIFDPDGHELGDIPLSERSLELLRENGSQVVILYHTPRMLEGAKRNGSFTLRRDGERLITRDVAALREYAAMQAQIGALRRRVLGPD